MVTKPSWPVLKTGSTGKNVSALQCLLIYHGQSLAVDGNFGTGTMTALANFQSANGLDPDGRAGSDTLPKLIVTVVKGRVDYAARAAQYLLSKFESIDIDGGFGVASKSTTETFQQKMGIEVDGCVGPETWQYLFGYDAYSDSSTPVTPGTSAYKDYLGQDILTPAQVALLNENKPFYESSAEKYGIPWKMIAAIHYRENKLLRIGPSNQNGPYQIWGRTYPVGSYTDAQFQSATDDAADFIKKKAGSRDLSKADNVKYTFFAYNGIASAYITQATNLGFTSAQANIGEGSPYVMNRADAKRDATVEPTKSNNTWGQIKTDGGPIVYPANTDYGAFVLYSVL